MKMIARDQVGFLCHRRITTVTEQVPLLKCFNLIYGSASVSVFFLLTGEGPTCTLVSVFKIMSNQAILVWRIAEEGT